MSNSSDGRPPSPPQGRRPAPPRYTEAETRANRRYPTPPRPRAPIDDPWNERTDDGLYDNDPAQPTYAPLDDALDPRTGPPAFDFQPSPLQPRRGTPAQSNPPPHPATDRTHDHGRVPHHPSELQENDTAGTFGHAPGRQDGGPTLSAPSRSSRSNREMANAPIVRADSVTGRSLTLVIAIMCFLACLTAGAVYMMNQSANAWLRDIAAEVTVQVEAREKIDVDVQVRDVSAYLRRQPGILSAKPLSLEVSAGLLEPWLGHAEGLKSLPVPRLIAVEVDRFNPPDFDALRTTLEREYKGTSLDDHRHWQSQIRKITRSFALGGLAILILVGAATTAIIVSATRSAMASNREIVEVLHFVGATDRFIARQFQRHFLSLGVRAGVVGAVLAGLAFLSIPVAMQFLGGGTASAAELQHLVGTGALDWQGYGWLSAVVVVVSALCSFTSRIGVYRILHSQH